MTSAFRLAILSDLHAAPKASSPLTGEVKLFTDQEHVAPTEHPIRGLKALIDNNKLKADVVVCPGDMTNKANAQALSYVWSSLHEIRGLLGAQGVVATVGNHDVDSRGHSVDSFPRESLMRLDPPFPAGASNISDKYWAHGYCFQEFGEARFLVINTCWLHESRDELERGVVTDYTLERIRAELLELPKVKVNFAVFHHHPHPHTDLKLGFDDVIRNGQKLLDLLSEDGHWMVIHGHKHHPKVEYAQGQFRQPIVLACGSFSGRLEGDNALVSKNYFHIVEVLRSGGRLAGKISSWNWIPGLGWSKYSSTMPGFPCEVGFGSSANVDQLAVSVEKWIGKSAAVTWSVLIGQEPELLFLMPRQLKELLNILRTRHNVETVYDELGFPKQLGPELN